LAKFSHDDISSPFSKNKKKKKKKKLGYQWNEKNAKKEISLLFIDTHS